MKTASLHKQRFGRLTVYHKLSFSDKKGQALWFCVCDCGNTTIGKTANLNAGRKKSCGCNIARLRGNKNPNWKPNVEVKCSNCDTKKMIRPSWAIYKDYFCDNVCKGEWQKDNLTGENNPSYNGGSPEQRIIGKRMNCMMRKSLKKGKDGYSWEKLLGYTRKQLFEHLDSTMPDGYTWDDLADLHIDHIIPRSSFTFNDYSDADVKKCWAMDNLQFLPAVENMQKGCKEAVRQ